MSRFREETIRTDDKKKAHLTVRLFCLRGPDADDRKMARPHRRQFAATGRHPAASASASEQNHRSPRESSILTRSYQGLHGI